MFIYPENLKAKPMLWLWELRDIGIIGVGFLLSVLALSQGAGMIPLVITVLFSFLTIRVDGSSILDFLRRAACFLTCSSNTTNGGLTHDSQRKIGSSATPVHSTAHGYAGYCITRNYDFQFELVFFSSDLITFPFYHPRESVPE